MKLECKDRNFRYRPMRNIGLPVGYTLLSISLLVYRGRASVAYQRGGKCGKSFLPIGVGDRSILEHELNDDLVGIWLLKLDNFLC